MGPAKALGQVASRFEQSTREAFAHWQSHGTQPSSAIIEQQVFMTLRFIQGVMLDHVRGAGPRPTAEQIDRLIQAILAGVRDAAHHRE